MNKQEEKLYKKCYKAVKKLLKMYNKEPHDFSIEVMQVLWPLRDEIKKLEGVKKCSVLNA